jgi:23S rRNA pseudouridine2605 synthase
MVGQFYFGITTTPSYYLQTNSVSLRPNSIFMRGGKGKQTSGTSKTSNRGGKTSATSSSRPSGQRGGKGNQFSGQKRKPSQPMPKFSENIRLNKYLSNSGVCSRREADVLIESGVVSVNGQVVTELGFKVKPGDVVRYDGATISPDTRRYVLLNKPKDFSTQMDDPLAKRNAFTLVQKACKEMIIPIDNMNRQNTGLMLYTNDVDLMKKLVHPRRSLVQIYHISLNHAMSPEKLEEMVSGVRFGEDILKVADAQFVEGKPPREIGVEIRSGKFRTIERILEKLGYEIVSTDRVQYGPLTKKDLPRGFFRHLTEQEIAFLKMS